jgi:hypothetical protein
LEVVERHPLDAAGAAATPAIFVGVIQPDRASAPTNDSRILGHSLLPGESQNEAGATPQVLVADLQKAAELNSDEDSLFYLLSKGLRVLGREEEAKKAMQRVSEIHAQTLATQKKALVDKHIIGTQ